MASPQANTKIEHAVEAVEGLTVAVVAAQRGNKSGMPGESRMRFNNVSDARQELRDAFAEFLSPVLRVVTPDGK
jgi:hypothetical protein